MSLVRCLSCSRHVRPLEAACPFCGATERTPLRPRTSVPRLGRAAILAFGTTVAAGACTGSTPEPAPAPSEARTSGGERAPAPPTPPQPSTYDPDDAGDPVPLYGGAY